MKFVREMTDESYTKLIEYASKTCDSFSLCQYDVYGGLSDYEAENFNIITSELKYSTDKIIENFSDEFLDEIYLNFINDNRMHFNTKLLSYLKQNSKNQEDYENSIYLYNKQALTIGIELFVLDFKIKKLFKKYKCYLADEENVENGICYKFKLNSKTINILNEVHNIYDFIYPKNLEDLWIYRNGEVWLDSVAHEEICCIYPANNEEYELLKSFGIKFHEEKNNNYTIMS